MYLAVDIGGTKTLLACFDDSQKLIKESRFPTAQNYNKFLEDFRHELGELGINDFRAGGVGMPGRIDRKHGRSITAGPNLAWRNVPIQADIEDIIKAPLAVENDAKLAGLSEASLIKDDFRKVLYITVSTGIGTGIIINGVIATDFADMEGGSMLLEHNDKLQKWESFASGKAIVEKYGKRAEEIADQAAWKEIARNLAIGFNNLIVVIQPDVVVVGGGVGQYLDKFYDYLMIELKKYENPVAPIPPIRVAKRPEEAVIYGAYLLAKQKFGAHSKTNKV